MLIFYQRVGSKFVLSVYTTWFGDVQASYGRYERLATYFGFVIITLPAIMASLRLIDRLSHRSPGWKRMIIAFGAWQLAVVAILIWSYESGLSFKVSQLEWTLFGPPDDLYSFRNLVLHRVITWLLCTTPIAWLVLLGYSVCGKARPMLTRDSAEGANSAKQL